MDQREYKLHKQDDIESLREFKERSKIPELICQLKQNLQRLSHSMYFCLEISRKMNWGDLSES